MVKNQKTKKTWIFPCQSWLSLYESDCQVKRILKPASEDQRPERVGMYKYIILMTCFGTVSIFIWKIFSL